MSNSETQGLPMKWHKFLIYFSLWAGALLAASNGVQLLTGSVYGSEEAALQVYSHFNGLKSADMVFGVLQICLAVYLIYTRFQLAGFKEGAPSKLTVAYVLSLALNIGYLFVLSGITQISVTDLAEGESSTVSGIIMSIVMIFANRSYYQKREHLFGKGSDASGNNAAAVTATPPAAVAPPVTSSQPRFCTKCGKKADPDDRWCTQCGTKLDD